MRPEPFGAMAYHFDTRRLVFLKTPALVELVHSLVDYDSVNSAVAAAVDGDEHKANLYVTALSSLADAGVICER
ncbi:MAG: mycofactocin biosynthesis chaperone MftB [Acidimicrobiales bacterium]